jgi:hypothetical protein
MKTTSRPPSLLWTVAAIAVGGFVVGLGIGLRMMHAF